MPNVEYQPNGSPSISISLIVAVRNEQLRIEPLLRSIESIEYQGDWEVIFIDDGSTDQSKNTIAKFIDENAKIKAKLISAKKQGKKNAITEGIDLSRHDYILTIDADCTFKSGILNCYSKSFLLGNIFIAGPVKMSSSNLFQRLQSIEFAGLTGAGAILLSAGNPFYCNGANMAYKKSAFIKVKGYHGNEHIASGDDQFLLQKMSRSFPDKIAYLKSKEAIVTTEAEPSFQKLINQRIRWSSKWKKFRSLKIVLGSLLFFISYASVPILIVLLLTNQVNLLPVIIAVASKLMVEYLYIKRLNRFFELESFTVSVLSLQIIYPFFIIFLAIASIFGSYSWKGRHYDG
ncbi:MAG: glycosyltransferase [Cyclobacteriaceae bacterium]